MKIQLFNRNLWLTCDQMNWIVGRAYVEPKSGKEKMVDCRYYSSVANALRHTANQLLEEFDSLDDMALAIVKFRDWAIESLDFGDLDRLRASEAKNSG